MALALTMMLASCDPADPLPPPIDAAALHRAEHIDFATLRPHVSPTCNGHSNAPGLSSWLRWMTGSHRLMMGLGFHGLSHWRKPGVEEALVEPALGAELRRASTHIILNMPADHIGHDATGLPANCPTRYVLSAPSYSGRLAFIDRDYFCSLCGSGATLAMKYDGREWQLVAIHGSWVS